MNTVAPNVLPTRTTLLPATLQAFQLRAGDVCRVLDGLDGLDGIDAPPEMLLAPLTRHGVIVADNSRIWSVCVRGHDTIKPGELVPLPRTARVERVDFRAMLFLGH